MARSKLKKDCWAENLCKKYPVRGVLFFPLKELRIQFSSIFVNLQKAFGTVDHNILLDKLKHYGIRGVNYSWFESYLKKKNNMFQSMNLILKICKFLMVFHKVLFLDHYYFFFTSMICILLLNSARFIILLMTLIFCI